MKFLLPSDLLRLGRVEGVWPTNTVALDTETSGLFADDGARVSTTSLAWEDPLRQWRPLKDKVNWDTETFAPGQHAYIVSMAWPFDQGVAGKPEDNGQDSLFASEQENLDIVEWMALCEWLLEVGSRVGFVMHHSKFDCEKMRVGVRRWPNIGIDLMRFVRWDTQNVNHLLWPLMPHPKTGRPTTSLKPTTSVLFEEDTADEADLVKAYLKKNKLPAGRWDLMPWDVIGDYADKDARLTKRLELRQKYDINAGIAGEWMHDEGQFPGDVDPRNNVYRLIGRRMATTRVLYEMERKGVPYDEVGSRDAADLCLQRAKLLGEELPFEPTGPQAKQFFFGPTDGKTKRGHVCLGLTPYAVSEKTQEPSMTAEIVARMVEDEIPWAEKWAEYVKVNNAASMWYTAYADAMGTDGRLRTNFRQHGTRSSRFSVERINLQAIPQDYRLTEFRVLEGIPTPRQLIAAAVDRMEGWRLYELDLAQAELRVGAMFADCTRMLNMIANDEDLHTFTTLALFPHVTQDDPLFKSKWRQVGKRANFSLQFGAKGNTFAKMVSKETGIRLQPHEATEIVESWNRLYPEYTRAIERHATKVAMRQAKHGKGWIDLIGGERRWFEQYEETHKAFNQRVQGNLAQFGIDWMLRTNDYLDNECGLGEEQAGLILTIHDSQVLLLPEDTGDELAAVCAAFGKELWADRFPGVPGDVDYKAW